MKNRERNKVKSCLELKTSGLVIFHILCYISLVALLQHLDIKQKYQNTVECNV